MAERIRLSDKGGGAYFAAPKSHREFIPTGCRLLDLALGGGWAERRISNIIGDKSTGKTLLTIEAAANFARKYKKGRIRHRECESAFDEPYAGALGMPLDRVDFGGEMLETVEDLFEDLSKIIKGAKDPELVIVDSLDALSDRSEMSRDMDEGSYGTGKAKMMSQLFRRLVRALDASNVTLIIVSQVRDKIGVFKGKKTTRSGGRALDFYATQIITLAQIGMIIKTVQSLKRPIGINVKAKVDKNKVSLPGREAEFQLLFGYGIYDEEASARWLAQVGRLKDAGLVKDDLKRLGGLLAGPDAADVRNDLEKAVVKAWYEIEQGFVPQRRKYE